MVEAAIKVILVGKKYWTFLIAIFAGIVSGALVSELLKMILPTGVVKDFLTYSVNFGLDPLGINLGALKFTFGLIFSFTVVSLLFLIAVVYYFKWWL